MTAPSQAVSSRTILVVDDEPAVRQVVSRLLEEWDFKVIEADNGRAALQAAGKFMGEVSLVITDLAMPYMDGYELAQAFRLLHPGVPILFMTGRCPNALVGSLSSNPADNLLFKPFAPDEFLDAVARLLEARINRGRVPA